MQEPAYKSPALAGKHGTNALPEREMFRDADLSVVRQDRVDFGSRKAGGLYSYVYRFAEYRLECAGRRYRARRYADEWSSVSLFPADDAPAWTEVPYDDDGFVRCARYFFALADVDRVQAFVASASGYLALARSRLGLP